MSSSTTLPTRGPARVLVLLDQPLVAEIVAFTLNHGVYDTRIAASVDEARALLREWHPHIAVVDMDIGGGQVVELTRDQLAATSRCSRSPAVATCRPSSRRSIEASTTS